MTKIDAAIAVVVWDGLVLICAPNSQDGSDNYWSFPRADLCGEESLEQCLLKKLREQWNIDVQIAGATAASAATVELEQSEVRVTLHPFVCYWTGGEAHPQAGEQFQWAQPETLHDFPFPPAMEPLIAWIQEHLFPAEISEELNRQHELDGVRIRQLSQSRRAAIRISSYLLMTTAASLVAGADLLWRAIRRFRLSGVGLRPILYLIAAGLLGWVSIRHLSKSRAISREVRRENACEPGITPDFSTLSDGGHIVRNLEEMNADKTAKW